MHHLSHTIWATFKVPLQQPHGLLCKMQDLKTTTHDESFLTIYQNYGTASQTHQSYSTVRSLVNNYHQRILIVLCSCPLNKNWQFQHDLNPGRSVESLFASFVELSGRVREIESTLLPGLAVTIRDVNGGNISSVWV